MHTRCASRLPPPISIRRRANSRRVALPAVFRPVQFRADVNTCLLILQADSGAGGALRSRIRSDSRCTPDFAGLRSQLFEDSRVEAWSETDPTTDGRNATGQTAAVELNGTDRRPKLKFANLAA